MKKKQKAGKGTVECNEKRDIDGTVRTYELIVRFSQVSVVYVPVVYDWRSEEKFEQYNFSVIFLRTYVPDRKERTLIETKLYTISSFKKLSEMMSFFNHSFFQ